MHVIDAMRARGIVTIVLTLLGCERGRDRGRPDAATTTAAVVKGDAQRELVQTVRAYGVKDERVVAAIATVPRHELVPSDMRPFAYEDQPLPIGEDQTISQPSLVALMTELAKIEPGEKVLEIGTGSGYQAAILAELTDKVFTIEIVETLGKRARADLERLGYGGKIRFRIGDGYAGWPEAAPFDAIIVTAAPPEIPPPLREQLAVGGRLVIPVGEKNQELRVIERTAAGYVDHPSVLVRFVPMTGRAQEKKKD
jgi:protein-L-isoaspartate(D-aspartate) O-methyltransferase